MKEDLKRRAWTIALTVLGLVFTLLVPAALKSSYYMDLAKAQGPVYEKERIIKQLVDMVGVNGLVVAVLLAAAVLWAVSGFCYLHNSRQVDFYHSIPVKRYQLFMASYLNGILVPMAIYLAVQMLSVALILRTGIGASTLGGTWWRMFLLNLVYYGMMYTTAVIAMMLTGNRIIALLGTVVFCSYGPAVVALTLLYKSSWFHTYYETEAQLAAWERAVKYSSPFACYMYAIGDFSSGSPGAAGMAGAVAVTAALAVAAYALYRIRPSESAGRAMAFRKTESPIKHLIALPVGVVFGMFFYELRDTLPWAVFGVLCGTGLTCCIMEIIYHFDFRKLFANWTHLAACFGISLLLVLAGMYDWFGYDSWLPDAGSVKSAAVVFDYDDNWVTYGDVKIEKDYAGRDMARWDYEGQADYRFEHMDLADIDTVMELGKRGVEANKRDRRVGNTDVWNYKERCIIEFRLKNGKRVYRLYRIPYEEMEPLWETVYDSREYKKGTYPVLEQAASDIAGVWVQQYNEKKELDLTAEEASRLLAVYQKELEGLSMATRKKELPIGTIQFRTQSLEDGIAFNKRNDYGYGLEERCYYPVYPSFTGTLKELENGGAGFVKLDAETVSDIRIQYYWEPGGAPGQEDGQAPREEAWEKDSAEIRMEVYKEEEDLEKLIPALVFMDYYNMNSCYEVVFPDNAGVYVTADFGASGSYDDRDGKSAGFQIDMGKLSKEDIHRFGFANVPN